MGRPALFTFLKYKNVANVYAKQVLIHIWSIRSCAGPVIADYHPPPHPGSLTEREVEERNNKFTVVK
jgi:hypothetical protein